jgi:hypothetical protein
VIDETDFSNENHFIRQQAKSNSETPAASIHQATKLSALRGNTIDQYIENTLWDFIPRNHDLSSEKTRRTGFMVGKPARRLSGLQAVWRYRNIVK